MEGKLEKLADYRTDKLKYWEPDELEDQLTRGMLSLFESKLLRLRGAAPSRRLTEQTFKRIKLHGLWLYSPDRMILDDNLKILPMDIVDVASYCVGKEDKYYCHSIYLEKWKKPLPKGWKRKGGGQLFSIYDLCSIEKGGIYGTYTFFSIDKTGQAFSCIEEINPGREDRITGIPMGTISERKELYEAAARKGTYVMQFASDSKYTWTITAIENGNKVHIGCLESEVKSLTYARSMPLTATGRKRPILHFVSAHKRRLQNGTDIDINEYKRGIVRFEMNGTQFEVKPPIIRNEVQ